MASWIMRSAIARLVLDPKKYVPMVPKVALQQLCRFFQGSSFYLQGQMDISPNSRWHGAEFTAATGGFFPKEGRRARRIHGLEPYDTTRRDMIVLLLRTVVDKGIEGDFAELGVYQGRTAKLIHHYAPERRLHLFDTFEGFTDRGAHAEAVKTSFKVEGSQFSDTSLQRVLDHVRPQNEHLMPHKGFFPDSIPPELTETRFAFVHLDADLYEPITEGLKFFYPRMARHGMILVHDYNAWLGSRRAVDDFFADKCELPIPMPDKSGSALIVKQ